MFKYVLAFVAVFGSINVLGQKSEIFQKNGTAINGFDVVSFFDDGKAVPGKLEYATEWKDARWLFSSSQHLDSFRANPEKYAPQYGGYCAYGAAEGHKAPTEVSTWTIRDEKLYFNYNNNVKKLWNKDTPGYIRKADENWEKIKHSE